MKCLERVLINHLKEKEAASTNENEDKQIDSLSEKMSEIQTDDATQEENWPNQSTKEDEVEVTEIEAAIEVHVKVYCKLGHLNLLLEDYPKGLFLFSLSYIFNSKCVRRMFKCFFFF